MTVAQAPAGTEAPREELSKIKQSSQTREDNIPPEKPKLLKEKNKRLVGIVNQKGGVGKTVTCMNLAAALTLAGQKVLLVDGDPQGNLTLFFTDRVGPDLAAGLKRLARGEDADWPASLRPGVRERLDLLPMFDRRLRLELRDAEMEKAGPAFVRDMAAFKSQYDWVLFDCSPSNGMLERLLVSACEAVLVPLEFQLFSVSGLRALLADIAAVAAEEKRNVGVEALIFTKIDNRLKRTRQYRGLFSAFNLPVFEIPKSELAVRALEEKKTIWEYDLKAHKVGPEYYNYVCMEYYQIVEKLFIG